MLYGREPIEPNEIRPYDNEPKRGITLLHSFLCNTTFTALILHQQMVNVNK